jgi:hypothetical protein
MSNAVTPVNFLDFPSEVILKVGDELVGTGYSISKSCWALAAVSKRCWLILRPLCRSRINIWSEKGCARHVRRLAQDPSWPPLVKTLNTCLLRGIWQPAIFSFNYTSLTEISIFPNSAPKGPAESDEILEATAELWRRFESVTTVNVRKSSLADSLDANELPNIFPRLDYLSLRNDVDGEWYSLWNRDLLLLRLSLSESCLPETIGDGEFDTLVTLIEQVPVRFPFTSQLEYGKADQKSRTGRGPPEIAVERWSWMGTTFSDHRPTLRSVMKPRLAFWKTFFSPSRNQALLPSVWSASVSKVRSSTRTGPTSVFHQSHTFRLDLSQI